VVLGRSASLLAALVMMMIELVMSVLVRVGVGDGSVGVDSVNGWV